MWISRVIFDALNKERIEALAVRDTLQQHNAQLQAHIEWMRIRLTQIELERAQMIFSYTGVKVPVPEIVKDDPPMQMAVPDFQDIGDDEAAKLGAGWDANGQLVFTTPKN